MYTVDLTPCPVTPANAFTPNGDGFNDTWNIPALVNFSNCTVDIFVRGGSRVFHSDGYGKAWDGTYGGKPLPVGVYYYIIDLKTRGYNKVDGYITLIR